jgi:ATP-dependent Clp protease ATP-binding subunit ClpC
MFERFTEQARRVLFFAREEASQLGSIRIDTEHLLLGLIREGKGLTNRLFADAAIALDDIRREVLGRVPARSKTSTTGDVTVHTLRHTALRA